MGKRKIARKLAEVGIRVKVSIKDYIIEKKETNLKGGLFDTLFMPTFWSFMPTFFHGFTTVLGNRISPHNYK